MKQRQPGRLRRHSARNTADPADPVPRTTSAPPIPVSIAILAGGRSSRMGRDKARVRLGSRSLLAHIRATASEMDLPVRVIRKDIVPPCGPLGGIYTALRSSRAEAELFLACDMPFISAAILRRILRQLRRSDRGCFASVSGLAGFPLILRPECAERIEAEIRSRRWSLQQLARTLQARLVPMSARHQAALENINTGEELQAARRRFRRGSADRDR